MRKPRLALPAGVRADEVEWEPEARRLPRLEREVLDFLRRSPEIAAKVTLAEAIQVRKSRDSAKKDAMLRRLARRLAHLRAAEQLLQAALLIPEAFRKTRLQRAERMAKRFHLPVLSALLIVNDFFENRNIANELADREAQRLKRGQK